jgi:hypothetical protein
LAGCDLVIGGVLAQAGRQIGARGIDRRLHVARGAVEAAIEAELQGDAGDADHALRTHPNDISNDAEMAFERGRHSRRHRGGAGSRHIRAHRDGRVIDLRQGRHRQL